MSADPTTAVAAPAVASPTTTTTATVTAYPAPYPYPYPYPTAALLAEARWLITRCMSRATDPVSATWLASHRHASHYWAAMATMLKDMYPGSSLPYPWPSPMPVPAPQDLMLLAIIDRLHGILDDWAAWYATLSDRGVAVTPWAAGYGS
jgi:hypothetical protein